MFGFAVAAVALHMVLGALSSQHVGVAAAGIMVHGCCGCHHHATQGVVGAVVAPCGSCPHHASSLSSPSIEGLGLVGPQGRGGHVYQHGDSTWLQKRMLAKKKKKEKREIIPVV